MTNIFACLIFNLVSFGAFYFLSQFTNKENDKDTPGTTIFIGFLTSMLILYVIWLIIPDRLDIACYILLFLSCIGAIFYFKKNNFKNFLKSEYFISFLLLTPFIYLLTYSPLAWDEFSHWLMVPKVFFHERTLAPEVTMQ